jgi:hypothetical protein
MTALRRPFHAINRRPCRRPRMSDNAGLSDMLGDPSELQQCHLHFTLDRTQKAFPGVGFSCFVTGLASRYFRASSLD